MRAIPGLSQALAGQTLLAEQVAQLDSKDMDFEVWQALALRTAHFLAQDDVAGIVITHGTDTLEETAYFLHAVLPRADLLHKPVVLTCAMRPASSAAPDGPQNVLDAVAVVSTPGACGVVVVCAGTVHGAVGLQKVHPYRLDAFSSGDGGPLGFVEEGRVRLVNKWPLEAVDNNEVAIEKIASVVYWPRVEIVMNVAGTRGALVDALLLAGRQDPDNAVQGLVVAGTGNGTVHFALEQALSKAVACGVRVVLASRCAWGRVISLPGARFPDSQGLSPVQARVALILSLLP